MGDWHKAPRANHFTGQPRGNRVDRFSLFTEKWGGGGGGGKGGGGTSRGASTSEPVEGRLQLNRGQVHFLATLQEPTDPVASAMEWGKGASGWDGHG